jgi:lysophospholipase L1-like esterase
MVGRLKQIIGNLLVSIIVTGVFLLIIEFIFRFIAPQELSGSWRTISEKGYMLNKASWESQHMLHGRKVNYKFNRFHQRADEPDEKKYNILTLGDSFTFGWLLDEDSTYVGLMQEYADKQMGKDKIQFLNSAAGGWGLADCYDYLDEFGDSVKPDMVLVYFNADDIGRSMNRNKFFNPDSKGAKFKKMFNDSKAYQWLLENSHLVQWVRNRLVNLSQEKTEAPKAHENKVIVPGSNIGTNEEAQKGARIAEELFTKIIDWCKKRNCRLVVLTTGWHFKNNEMSDRNDPELLFLSHAQDFFNKSNVPFADITPAVSTELKEKGEKEFIIEGDYHPNEKGARIIAKNSWEFLKPNINI